MKLFRILIFCGLLGIYLPTTLFAWSLEFGYRRLMPKIGVSQQSYEDEAGSTHTIKPTVEDTALGQSALLGIKLETYSIDLEQSEFKFDSTINAANEAVAVDTAISCTISEQRLGVNYHIERDLAGLYGGIGISSVVETLESSEAKWVFKTTSPYFKFGFDLILDSWIVRYEQVHLSIGEHNVRINSLGILLSI